MWKISHNSLPSEPASITAAGRALEQLLLRTDIGFYNISLLEQGMAASQELAKLKKEKYDQVCILGIGGSSLGTQALVESLVPECLEDQSILFFDNVDAKSFFRKLKHVINPEKTLWVLISKSGSTIETLTQAEFIDQWLNKNFKKRLAKNAVVITEPRSNPLFDWAQKNKIPTLEVPLTVGGRFSVLTPVGLFPLAMLGVDVAGLLEGAQKAFEQILMVRELAAQFSMSFERRETTTYFFHYCDDMRYWGQWLQQLWAESLGKKQAAGKKTAMAMSVPVACRGSTDQHSVLQQIAEGVQKKFVCFLRVNESEQFGDLLANQIFAEKSLLSGKNLGTLLNAEALATQQALNESQTHSLTLLSDQLNPQSLGFIMMLMELTVATLGTMYDLNPFDQPGVERGKVLTRTILSR